MTLPVPHQDLELELTRLAHEQARLRRSVLGRMQAGITAYAGPRGSALDRLPAGLRRELEKRLATALESVFAQGSAGPKGRQLSGAAVLSGAIGGAFGVAGALAELPVSLVIFLRAIREEAEALGLDPAREGVRQAAVDILMRAQVVAVEEALDAGFLNMRLGLSGAGLSTWVTRLAPRLLPVLGPRVAAGAVPIVGALGGALANGVWVDHYRSLARVRFGLMVLAERHGVAPVIEGWKRVEQLPVI